MKKTVSALLIVSLLCALCALASAEHLDNYFQARFNKSPAFFTGPGTDYYRANNGKAQYGGGGVARVYGYEGKWLLLGYETSGGLYRIGYFQDSYLKNMTVVSGNGNPRKLNFEYRDAWIASTCQITDDPVMKETPFATLQRGHNCTYLASMGGNWAYIEVYLNSEKKTARGFVPMNSVSFSYNNGSAFDFTPTVTAVPGTGYADGFYSGGTWATASGQLSTYSGPANYYTYTGTYNMQNQAVYCLSKHYDSSSNGFWVLCRLTDGNGAQYVWTNANSFYNADWLLSRLPQE